MKLIVAIPAYNEASVISDVIKSVKQTLKNLSLFQKKSVVVVDDGSSDKTGNEAVREADVVLTHVINLGLGAAIQTAFVYARINRADVLVTFDADGQHVARDIARLIQPIIKNQADIVIGSRMLGLGRMPILRELVNITANYVTFITTGVKTGDSQSGLRAFNKKAIQKINIISKGMEVSSEIFMHIKTLRLKLAEIPIKAIYTTYSRAKGQPLTDAPKVFFRLLFRIIK